jgi:hypothetical protein
MTRVIDRLNSNFDSNKFGTDKNLSEKAKNYLNTVPISIATWAKNDLANSSVSRSDYFQNPVSSVISSITSNVNSIISVCVNDPANTFALASAEAQDLANSSNTLISELSEFSKHTNRISGVSSPSANTEEEALKPNYISCVSVGSVVLTITANTDGVSDASPILNNFTSLYIETELASNNWSIGNSTVFLTGADTNTVTPVQLDEIRNKINTAYSLINTRRISDENYYYTSQQIVEDFQLLNSLQNSGSTERNLINSKIGTTRLKNNLSS